MHWILKLLDGFVPENLLEDQGSDSLRKSRIITGLSIFGGGVYLLLITIYQWEIGDSVHRYSDYLFAPLFFIAPFILKYYGKVSFSGLILTIVTTITLSYSVLMDGIFPNPALGWFVVVIMVSVHLVSTRLGFIYAFYFSFYTIGMYALGIYTEIITILPLLPGQGSITDVFALCFLFFLVAFTSSSIESARNDAMQEVIELNNDLIIQKSKADEAVIAKADFMARMSHEIRTPLSGITGLVGLLQKEDVTDTQRAYISALKGSGEILLKIMDDILDFSKFDSKKSFLEKTGFSLTNAMRESASLWNDAARRKNLKLLVDVDDRIPHVVIGDSIRYKQILSNLISNALKFSERGSVTIRADVEKTDSESFIKSSVIDTGIGIEQDDLSRLFLPFSQIDGSKSDVQKGTGLGLSICKVLAELMGGNIGVNSEAGKGSCFWFTVPMIEGTNKDLLADEETRELPAMKEKLKKAKVLVAEDNSINQFVIKKLLAHMNINCNVVSDGREAVEEVSRKDYDIIIMDCRLPGINGFEASSRIRDAQLPSKPVIIAMTADVFGDIREKCKAAGMDHYMSKPLKYESLKELIISIIESRSV